MAERLQKLISAAHFASRRAAEQLILNGCVTVNGITATLGQTADPASDTILINGTPLRFSDEKTYIMLNKPRGYVTTLSDEKGRKTVAELVGDAGVRLYPVGRLDLNSDGLLLMTDDGALANALMHPGHEVNKVYRTVVEGDVEAALPVLRSAMEIDGCKLRPAEVNPVGDGVLEITIHEGKNRQVRKMCAAADLYVRRLTRIAEGPVTLGELPVGKWRRLTENEVEALKKAAELHD